MNKKKLLALLMALVMTFSLVPVTAFAEEPVTAMSYNDFIAALIAGNGFFDGTDESFSSYSKDTDGRLIVSWSPKSGCRTIDAGNHQYAGCNHETVATYETPNRVNGGCAQYQITSSMVPGDVSIANTSFVYNSTGDQSDGSFWYDANGWNGTGANNLPGEIQFENHGDIVIDNCAFDNVSVTPYYNGAATEYGLTVTNSVFKNIQKAGLRGIQAKNVQISGCSFEASKNGIDFVQNNMRSDDSVILENNSFSNVENLFKLRTITNKVSVSGTNTIASGATTLFSYDTEGFDVTTVLSISAGTYNLNPGVYTGNDSVERSYVAEGYVSKDNGNGTWTVEPAVAATPVAQIGSTPFATLAAAIDAANASSDADVTIKLLENVETGESYTHSHPLILSKEGAILDLNGKTLTITYSMSFILQGDGIRLENGIVAPGVLTGDDWCRYGLVVNGCKNVVIKDVVSTTGFIFGGDAENSYTPNAALAKDVQLINCTVTGVKKENASDVRYALCAQLGSNVIIKGGQFYAAESSANKTVIYAASATDGGEGTFVIHSGSFLGTINNGKNINNVVIYGGIYSTNPSGTATIADGYEVVNNPDTNNNDAYPWTVVPADNYVAQVVRNDIPVSIHTTLQAAFAAAQDGDIVELLKDVDATDAMYSGDTRFNLWIDKSITLDGAGYTLTVKGRGIGVQGASDNDNIDVTIKNITVKNVGNVNGRCVDTRGKLNSLTLENATLTTAESSYTGYLQPLTIGGNQSTPTTTVTIKDSNLVTVETAKKGYAITTFNPVNMTVTGSTIKGWACFNLKGADSSAGSKNSEITVSDSTLVSANGTPGDTNAYSLIKIEDDNIDVTITDTVMEVSGDKNTQSIVSFQKLDGTSSANCEVSLGGGNKVTLEGSYRFASNMGDSSKLSISGGLFNKTVPETCCAAGYIPAASSDSTHQHTVKQGTYVAQIGDVKYETLQAAFNAVQSGETIILLNNLTQDDGVKFDHAGVSAKLDLNNNTFTVNNGANLNNRAIRIDNGTLEVCNGTIVAVGSGTTSSNGAGCYGAFRVEANGVLNAHDLTLTNARPWGLNVKVLGGEATLTRVTINSSYGGGIEVTEATLGTQSKKGEATLTNCTFTQTDYYDHCSTCVSVSGGSKLTVNSGSYTGENYAAYVFSSGGYITVNGGTFTSTKEGDNTAAFIAMIDTSTYEGYKGGLIFNGGKFSGNFSITDPATAVITGGHFTADPEAYLAEGYEKVESTESGYTWSVQAKAVAQIGTTKYTDLQEAFDAAQSGETVQLLTDIVSNSWFDVNGNEANPEQKSISLDLNGYNISSHGLWQAGGSLNVTGKGTITSTDPGAAPISIYFKQDKTAKRTLTIGPNVTLVGTEYGINIFGSNDATVNTIDVNINGTVKGTVFILGNLTNDSNAIMVNVNGTVDTTGLDADSDGYLPNGIALNGYANVTVNSGAVVKGGTAVEVRAGNLTINGGTFTALQNAYSNSANSSGVASHGAAVAVMQHTTAKKIVARINGGTFEGPCALGIANPQVNNDDNVTVTVTGGIFKGELNQTVIKDDNRVTGFISGGTYYDESVKTEDYIASGYEAVQIDEYNRASAGFNGNNAYDGWYQVGKISSGTITKAAEQSTANAVTYTAPRTVVNEDNNGAALQTGSEVTVNVKAPVTAAAASGVENIATNNALALYTDNQLSAVVSAAMPEVAESADAIDVEIVIVKDGGRQEENNNKVTKVTYDVHPEAIVYQGDAKIGSVNLEEVELKSGESYTIKLPTTGFSEGDKVRVTHIHANGESEIIDTYTVDNTGYIVINNITSFSDFELAYVDNLADDVSVSTGMTLSLNESIDVNMYLYNLKGATVGKYTVSSWVNDRKVLNNVALSESDKHSSQIKNTDAYKLVVADCAAKEVGDTIRVEIRYDGTLVKEITYSVKQYCENACKSASNSTALQDLCRAVLDYGTAAQYNFSYNVSNPANENYSNWATVQSSSIPSEKNVKNSSVLGTNPFYTTGMTLSLESKVEINFYFRPIGDINQYTFTVKRGDNEPESVAISKLTQNGSYYVLKVDGIAAVDLDEAVTVTGSYEGSSKSITYSPLSYAYVNQNVSGYETLGDVLRAMYYYNQMAETYFNSIQH